MRKKLVAVSTERDGLLISLKEMKSTSNGLRRALEISQADSFESKLALEEARAALETSDTAREGSTRALERLQAEIGQVSAALSINDATLEESRAALRDSEKSLESTRTELSESTVALSELKTALADLNRELSQSKQRFQDATILAERWMKGCFSERQATIHFLARLTTAGAAVNDTLQQANTSVPAGLNSQNREGIQTAMHKMTTLVSQEIKLRIGKGQALKGWVGLRDIDHRPSASASRAHSTSPTESLPGGMQSMFVVVPSSSMQPYITGQQN